MTNDKALKALAAATVAIRTTYDDWREAILYGMALGVTLEAYKNPESQVLFAQMLDILSDGDEDVDALGALRTTADLMVAHLA